MIWRENYRSHSVWFWARLFYMATPGFDLLLAGLIGVRRPMGLAGWLNCHDDGGGLSALIFLFIAGVSGDRYLAFSRCSGGGPGQRRRRSVSLGQGVSTALVAALIARIVLFPVGALVDVPLWIRGRGSGDRVRRISWCKTIHCDWNYSR